MTFTSAVPVGDSSYRAVGSGSTTTTTTADLVVLDLTGNERAAEFSGVAVSDQGDIEEIFGVGFMVPEEGWKVFAGNAGGGSLLLVSSASPTILTFAVSGESFTGDRNWIGSLSIEFTQNYAS